MDAGPARYTRSAIFAEELRQLEKSVDRMANDVLGSNLPPGRPESHTDKNLAPPQDPRAETSELEQSSSDGNAEMETGSEGNVAETSEPGHGPKAQTTTSPIITKEYFQLK